MYNNDIYNYKDMILYRIAVNFALIYIKVHNCVYFFEIFIKLRKNNKFYLFYCRD